jgi:hypothetical protein
MGHPYFVHSSQLLARATRPGVLTPGRRVLASMSRRVPHSSGLCLSGCFDFCHGVIDITTRPSSSTRKSKSPPNQKKVG